MGGIFGTENVWFTHLISEISKRHTEYKLQQILYIEKLMREWNQLEAVMRMSDVVESPDFLTIVETLWNCMSYFEVDTM